MTCFMVRKALLRFTAMTRSHCSSGNSTTPPTSAMPTLLSSTSMRPKSAMHAFTIASTSSLLVTSARKGSARPLSPEMMFAVSSAAARLMSTQNTLAPSRAQATAVALPLPQPGPIEPAPTINATLSLRRLATGPLLSPCVELAQFGLQDLAVIVLRECVDEHVILRPLEARDFAEAQLVELARLHVADHIGDDDLPPFGGRPADDRSFAHTSVLEQHLLDLTRINVRAARDDHVLGAIFQCEVTIRVKHADVARVQPAAAQGLRRRVRTFPVARHHHIATADDLSDLSGPQRVVLRVRDLHVEARIGAPRRAEPFEPARMFAVRDVLSGQHRDCHRTFALPVDLRKPRPEAVERMKRILHIHRRATPHDGAQVVRLRAAGEIDQPLDHRGRREHRHAAPTREHTEDFVRLEAAGLRDHVDAHACHMRHHV